MIYCLLSSLKYHFKADRLGKKVEDETNAKMFIQKDRLPRSQQK